MRPHTDEFILSVSQYFELIAFTNMPRMLLRRICNEISEKASGGLVKFSAILTKEYFLKLPTGRKVENF